ncbi:MAG: TlpA family protein disulfide reductase [Polaromonas sp.]|nr:TlpA family protein disulfide reductase [Polaromonas sp.]
MNRRNLALGGVAALAGLAGVGVAWQKFQPHGAGYVGGTAATTDEAFWNLSFDTPDARNLLMSSFRGRPLLVNFWATWCPPCIEELPLLDAFYQENKGKNWQVLGVAVDQPSAVRKWLQVKPLSFPVAMAGLTGTELSKTLGNLAGSLPFSVVFGASGELLHRKTGKVSKEDLGLWLQLK